MMFKKKKIGKTLGVSGHYRPSAVKKRRRQALKKIPQNTEKKLLKPKPLSKKAKRLIRPLILIAIGIVLYSITHFFFISGIFTIANIEYDKNSVVVEDEDPILNYVKNFKGENIFLVDTNDEETYLSNAHPEYKAIKIKKSFPKTLIVDIELFEVAANLITETEGIVRKFIVSENGITVEADSEDPSLPYIYIETPEIIIEGGEGIEANALSFTLEAIEDFENKFGMQILDVTYYKTARELHLHTERYFDVWMDTQLTVDEQLNKLKQALPSLNIYEEDLEYIDLRISGQSGDKVIYMPS